MLLSSNFPKERVAPKDQACTKVLPHKKRTNTYTKTCIYCSYCKYNTKKLQGKTNKHTYFVKKEYLRKLMVYYKGKIERECCLVHEALRHWKQWKWKTENSQDENKACLSKKTSCKTWPLNYILLLIRCQIK